MKTVAVRDFRSAARKRIPHFLFEYFDGGSYDEVTVKRNEADLAAVALRQRVLQDVSAINLRQTLFQQEWALPIALGPVGLAGMAARRGETQAAKAAEKAGIPFCLSTVSVCPVEEMACAVEKPSWFQLYMLKDRGFMKELLHRAAETGCTTLIFTVDMPVAGARYRDYRSGLAGASDIPGSARRLVQALKRPAWAWDVGLFGRPHTLGNITPALKENPPLADFFAWIANNFDPSISWKDLALIRDNWKGPLIIKGIMDTADARLAADVGADGIVVSNHGGRQLDGVPSTASVLPEIAGAVGDELTVLCDGGVRSGLDIARMLALGARGVLLGRAWAFALAADGERGVQRMLELMETELRVAMALTGSTSLDALSQESLVSPLKIKKFFSTGSTHGD